MAGRAAGIQGRSAPEALLQLSREHHTALSIAQRVAGRPLALASAGEAAALAGRAHSRFVAELEPHFSTRSAGCFRRSPNAARTAMAAIVRRMSITGCVRVCRMGPMAGRCARGLCAHAG